MALLVELLATTETGAQSSEKPDVIHESTYSNLVLVRAAT